MNNEQYLNIIAAILATSEQSEEATMDKYLKLRQLLIDNAKQEQKKYKTKSEEM